MRIPIGYLAKLMTAGDGSVVDGVLRRLAAMRAYMRDINLGRDADESIAEAVGMNVEQVYEMYRLLAIAKYEHRYVIPAAHPEQAAALEESLGGCAWTTRAALGWVRYPLPVRCGQARLRWSHST